MIERRNQPGRALCSGIVVGALAGALLALLEVVGLVVGARPVLLLAGGARAFAPPLLGVAAGAGAIVGLAQGALVAAVDQAVSALAARGRDHRRWAAAFYTLAATPAIAWLCVEAFSGRRARALPLAALWVAGAATVLCAATYGVLRLLFGTVARVAARRRSLSAALAAAGLFVAAAGLLAADRRVFWRLYPFFHATLEALAFFALELAVLAAAASASAGGRRWARLAGPATAGATLFFAAAAAAAGLARFREADAAGLRVVAHEYGAVSARLLDLARALGLGAKEDFFAAAPPPGAPPAPATGTAPPASEGAAPAAGAATPRGPRFPGANVVLITVDALRADHLGVYGYDRPTSPRLDELSHRSIVFEKAYAAVTHTSFSVASLLTGKYAYSLSRLGLLGGHETLADVLRRYGYKTAGFFPPAVFYVDGERFREYEERRYGFDYVRYEPFPEDVDARARTDQVIRFLETEGRGRVFVWVHYFGPHEPYVDHPEVGPPLPFGPRAVDRYDGEIRWVDGEIGRLIDYLARTRPNTIVVVTADHGEEFGEHGGAYHGTTLYDEQLRVPLLFALPDGRAARVPGPVSTVDVVPTVLALLDASISPRVRGHDLSPWMEAERAPPPGALPPVFAELDAQKLVAVGTEKLICDGERAYCRLFDLAVDPREVRDRAAERPGRVAELKAALSAWVASHGEIERRGPVGDPDAEARRVVLERGRLGDREAAPALAALVADERAPEADRLAAARALARLSDPRARAGLSAARAKARAGPFSAWVNVALAALGDADALAAVRRLDPEIVRAEPELAARAALAHAAAAPAAAADDLLAALALVQDIDLRRQLLSALGRTRDPRGRAALLEAYAVVRTRRYAAEALGELGDRAAVPFLVERLGDEPYTSVRAAVARALGQLRDRRALGSLRAAWARERETQVLAAVAGALARLGVAPRASGAARPLVLRKPAGARELWIVPDAAAGSTTPMGVTLHGRGLVLENVAIDRTVSRDAYLVPLHDAVTGVTIPQGAAALFR